MSLGTRTALLATAVAGTLDILSAFFFASFARVTAPQVLRFVASGPFGDGMRSGGLSQAIVGLAVHYTLMLVMVSIYIAVASRWDRLRNAWAVSGAAYGLAIYAVMYWIVVPARFGAYPKVTPWAVGNALFSHIFCVGIPMAYLVYRQYRNRPTNGDEKLLTPMSVA